VEWPAEREAAPVPPHWQTVRESRAGRVRYGLFRPADAPPGDPGEGAQGATARE